MEMSLHVKTRRIADHADLVRWTTGDTLL
jgi:hypothetical protein